MIRELGPVPRARLLAAAAAADRDGRGVTVLDGDGWDGTIVAVDPIDEVRVAFGDDLAAVARELNRHVLAAAPGWNGLRAAPRTFGYVAYEAARSLERPSWRAPDTRPDPIGAAMILRRYAGVIRRDARTGIAAVEGDVDLALAGSIAPASLDLSPVDDDAAHAARIRRAIELIANGDLYVVNLARTFEGRTDATATELLATMLSRTSAPYAAAMSFGDHALASTSPELFLDIHNNIIKTTPIKGTRPRGVDAASDRARVLELAADPKERAELTMIVDLERNDLGRVADVGSVRVPSDARIETTQTVHHRMCDVVARSSRSLGSIVTALFPSGSVTGAPKIRAMEVIADLERDRRGAYCGAIFALGAGYARAAMAIRTVLVERGRAVYHAGGGIVDGSDPDREVAETMWKARQVLSPHRTHRTI